MKMFTNIINLFICNDWVYTALSWKLLSFFPLNSQNAQLVKLSTMSATISIHVKFYFRNWQQKYSDNHITCLCRWPLWRHCCVLGQRKCRHVSAPRAGTKSPRRRWRWPSLSCPSSRQSAPWSERWWRWSGRTRDTQCPLSAAPRCRTSRADTGRWWRPWAGDEVSGVCPPSSAAMDKRQ